MRGWGAGESCSANKRLPSTYRSNPFHFLSHFAHSDHRSKFERKRQHGDRHRGREYHVSGDTSLTSPGGWVPPGPPKAKDSSGPERPRVDLGFGAHVVLSSSYDLRSETCSSGP